MCGHMFAVLSSCECSAVFAVCAKLVSECHAVNAFLVGCFDASLSQALITMFTFMFDLMDFMVCCWAVFQFQVFRTI